MAYAAYREHPVAVVRKGLQRAQADGVHQLEALLDGHVAHGTLERLDPAARRGLLERHDQPEPAVVRERLDVLLEAVRDLVVVEVGVRHVAERSGRPQEGQREGRRERAGEHADVQRRLSSIGSPATYLRGLLDRLDVQTPGGLAGSGLR